MTPQELAKVCLMASDMHEASWDNDDKTYRQTWSECTENALEQLGHSQEYYIVIYIALQTEYVDIWDWCKTMV